MDKLGAGEPLGRIGAYRLLGRLGAGGMGEVLLARSDRGRTVAVKLVRRELAEQDEFRSRFRQEVEAARRVGGQWTAPVLDADTEAEVPWVATGYVAGPSLQQVVGQDHGPLPERSVRILAAGLAHALGDIHRAGLVHRDLKPSNVLVTIDGPRVIDFGIARALETVTDGGLTRTGALVGSPGFMAPEQVRGDTITPACDVFCLGSILAYAATGALPFGTANSGVHALMFRIAQEAPDLSEVPESLAELVRDCLQKNPAARPGLDEILERTGAEDTVADGRARDPWLPGALVAQLGRHAVQLLDREHAAEPTDSAAPAEPAAPAAPGEQAGPGKQAGSVAPATPTGPPSTPPPAPPAALNHVPTQVSATTPSPHPGAATHTPPPAPPTPAAPPAHSYGYPHPYGAHPAPAATPVPPPHGPTPPYTPAPPYGSTPPYASTPPYEPGVATTLDHQTPQPTRRRSGALLAAVALVVALGAGGAVFLLMKDDGETTASDGKKPTGPVTPGPTSDPTDQGGGTTGSSGEPDPTDTAPSPSGPGEVPAAFLGKWSGSIDNDAGHSTRDLVIQQGSTGDTVLSLTADGPAEGGGSYHCVFQAELTEKVDDSTLTLGPSTVIVGEPATSCTPGAASTVTLLPDGSLERVNNDNGDKLTYTKAG
ncbi:serine/threonine protein kinase [Streptomyces sp. NA04227]|uniref:serine/threonine-protein kinase n=1 Tax=Streptomyces sp. NA04227 TaxID=2742136 RepID=UPI001591B41F|nr:serine/threonine-protein kinase [Streptomyces sp. NA04227]QKW07447.1 serine/threonine protein kinase [Streptomyces sp. NA04227]